MITESVAREFTPLEEYEMLPEGTCAELIDGVIYDMSPAPLVQHQRLVMRISNSIFNYIAGRKGKCEVFSSPFDVKLSDDTVVQPDVCVICDPDKLTYRGCDGAPEWVIEITSSNFVHDYVTKLGLYQKYGVKEYWIVNPKIETTIVYQFDENCGLTEVVSYKFIENITVGIYKNREEPLVINIAAILG